MSRASGSAELDSGLFHERPRDLVIRDLVNRSRRRLEALPDAALESLLEDALWHERKRLERKPEDSGHEILDALARGLLRGDRKQRLDAGLALVNSWGDEIHGRFDPRVYRVATRFLPRALTALLSGRRGRLRDWQPLEPSETRIQVRGPLKLVQELSREATLVLAPTHVSNLDSPLVGLVLYLAGLPPFVYGAGLNLFSNKIIGWWMHRLGAYTVDRTKKAAIYKDVLKDYSIRALTTRHHSLFFPGGTRARSGEIERSLKKGLLGTAIVAWQEMLAAGRPDSEVYVVPCTLSMSLVLEAATLIEDFLAESGKQRYIITDDEFAQPRRLAAFANRVLDLDSAVVARFGQPLDVFGNPVDPDPAARKAQALRRRGYVTGRDGKVEWDDQRDHVYTQRLAESLCESFVDNTEVLATHAAAAAAWNCISRQVGSADPFRVVRSPIEKRRIAPDVYRAELGNLLDRCRASANAGRGFVDTLEPDVDSVLATALDRFGRYHRSRVLVRRGSELVVEDPKLCFYYRNRLTWLDRAPAERARSTLGESR
jgi:glycerol-3-phosphate O-acyltransferase